MLDTQDLGYTIKVPLDVPPTCATPEAVAAYEKLCSDYNRALYILEDSINPEIINNPVWMGWNAYEFMQQL